MQLHISAEQNKHCLSALCLSDFLSNIVVPAGVPATFYESILQVLSQVSLSRLDDVNRVAFERKDVIGQSWASDPPSRTATNGLSIQSLHLELDTAAQFVKEPRIAKAKDSANFTESGLKSLS